MKLLAVLCALCVSAVQGRAGEPWTISTTNGRQHLVTPEGKPFVMLGLSHPIAVFSNEKPDGAKLDAVEAQLCGWDGALANFAPAPAPNAKQQQERRLHLHVRTSCSSSLTIRDTTRR
jgi:hypothetical protein